MCLPVLLLWQKPPCSLQSQTLPGPGEGLGFVPEIAHKERGSGKLHTHTACPCLVASIPGNCPAMPVVENPVSAARRSGG